MQMALKTHRWVRADLERLPDDGNRYEVVDGALFVTPPPSLGHERVHHALARVLQPFVDRHGLGELFNGRAAVILRDSHVEPDLLVSPPMLPRAMSWVDMPRPSLIVEVLSATTTRRDQVAKRDLYMHHGVPEYWIVDRERRSIRVIRPDGTDHVETSTLAWQPAGVSEALMIDLPALFREALD
ncbi:MAG: Uma2 family endonuclease [Gemmatimonadaceae bacterium]